MNEARVAGNCKPEAAHKDEKKKQQTKSIIFWNFEINTIDTSIRTNDDENGP